ncbi:hypothetical protein BK133_02915 [Paenibacillus sp. FSL H8-0548]|uniref:protoporphyrinogen/coproporphyrinogen oxidase n=1 Tax=Paenibacillus sp. FSL H8-0548 TaxID=1920422 RepID=UPI00096E7097|nr:NAD(P)-binding protein [Paenibacillus sp. FSL H8-0548]OMF37953.1 hypothetical protein BK133_02915 [Paenibacillus sp. FSL H8-0548]
MSVLVIGAGVTGLTFAKVFGDTEVFEAASAVGGKAGSVTVDTDVGPFVFDTGGHWFHQQNSPEVLKLLNGLPMKKHVRRAFVLINGCLYDFPIQRSYKAIPDLAFVKRVNYELLQNQSWKGIVHNYEDLLLRTYGKTLYETFFRDYNKKMYGLTDLSKIRVGQYDAVRNVPIHNKYGYNNEFYYPSDNRGAIGIPLHLSKDLSITLDASVQSINFKNRTMRILNKTMHWENLISTIPLPALVKMVSDVDPAILKLSHQLHASKGFILNLGIKKTAIHQDVDWVYIPNLDFHFYRIGFYSNVQPLLAPEGYDAMYVECSPLFFSNKDEAISLIPTIINELIELGFIRRKEDIITLNPIYLDQNYCLPDPDVTSIIRDYLKDHDVYSIGRYGSWHWSSQHEDMQQAIHLARELGTSQIVKYV